MSPSRRAAATAAMLATTLLLTACGSSFLPVRPEIDASLLQPCVDPILAPDDASDNELAAERLRFGKAYLDCKARHGALADRVGHVTER